MSTISILIFASVVLIILLLFGSFGKSKNKFPLQTDYSKQVGTTYQREKVKQFFDPFERAGQEDLEGYHIVMAVDTLGKPKDYKAPASDLDNWPPPISISYYIFNIRGELVKSNYLFILTDEIPSDQVLNEYGISKDYFKAKGIPAKEAYQQIKIDAASCKNLVAHNVSYLKKIIYADFKRNKVPFPFGKMRTTCTMKETTKFVGIEADYGDDYKWPNLEELIDACFFVSMDPEGIEIPEAQNSRWKARSIAKCFIYLKKIDEL
ncbi:3'-5' exonuclease family protein [Cyclobacterium marinum]|uniref:Uncharacterized protein n=1 Tax=Cyclobacterium marinum (strain ATCC 25205 / DSM 745 / LMG 13164 / NCIMB 1802) TaxID=880070 RepID=G0J1Y5_CYCMS|nr:hypothetical protein [Cyclobacterium marinum]AEL23991.1 hypothetical protein Cycma_0209 [Cyclobacterium marinum DSM 745]